MKPGSEVDRRGEISMQISENELREALQADIAKNGPILLWSGDGKIPGNFRGLVPRTLAGYLELILRGEVGESDAG